VELDILSKLQHANGTFSHELGSFLVIFPGQGRCFMIYSVLKALLVR